MASMGPETTSTTAGPSISRIERDGSEPPPGRAPASTPAAIVSWAAPAVPTPAARERPTDGGDDELGDDGRGVEDRDQVASPLTFEQLYRDEYDAMVRVAFLLVGSAETAEELVQDAFIKVHLRWSRVDTPRAFLRTCVVNGCRDRLRRRIRLRARLPRLQTEAADRAATGTSGPADAGPAAELHDVLLGLPIRQRTAIVGRFYCGWDDPTIAAVLGVRPGTVRSLVHRGLAALRTEIPR